MAKDESPGQIEIATLVTAQNDAIKFLASVVKDNTDWSEKVAEKRKAQIGASVSLLNIEVSSPFGGMPPELMQALMERAAGGAELKQVQ